MGFVCSHIEQMVGMGTDRAGMEIWREEESWEHVFRVSPSAQPFPRSPSLSDAGVWADPVPLA